MNRRPSGAPVLITTLLASFACMTAQASASPTVLESVTDYLRAFAAAYAPDPYDRAVLLDAEYAASRAGGTMAPHLTFEQSLDWSAYSTLNLDLEAGISMPLYDSRARSSRALTAVDLAAAEASLAAARAAAELSFFVDLATFAALAEASQALAPVLERLNEVPVQSDPTFDAMLLAPGDRGLYEAQLRLFGMHAFLTDQRSEVAHRIAHLVGVSDDRVAAPSIAVVRAAIPPRQTVDVCLSTSPMVAAARLRHEQATHFAALDATTPFTLELSSDLEATLLGPGPTGGTAFQWTPSATVALEARLGLPPGRSQWQRVDGTLTASASPTGASQSLRVSWPNPPQPTVLEPDPDAALADELSLVESEVRALVRAVDQAASERARLQRALGWVLLDAYGTTAGAPAVSPAPRDPAAAQPAPAEPAPVLPPDTPLGLAAQVADLSVQLVFAGLDEAIASAQLAAACGAWP